MLRTALRNVLAHKARLMMTALAVLLGTAFVAGTLIFSDTIGEAAKNASTRNLKDVAVSVETVRTGTDDESADGKRTTALDEKLAARIRALPGVANVRSDVNGPATLAGKDGRPVGEDWRNRAVNYLPGKDGRDDRYPLVQGRGPAAADELALAEATAKAAGYRIGDTVRFATDGPVLTKKLVGIVSTDDRQVIAGGSLALFDTATAQRLYLHPGQFSELVVTTHPGTDQQALTAQVRALLPKDRATATSGAELAAQQAKMVTAQNSAMSKTLLTFAGIALFVGVFLIANTFTMLISQRSREIALMRAIGASRRQVVRSVLAEAGLLGLLSSAIGFALGAGIAVGLRAVLDANGAHFPDGPVVVKPATVLYTLAVGVVVTVLAAWLPSRKAAKIAPVEALNTVEAPLAPRSLVLRNSLGLLVTGVGVAVMLYLSTFDVADENNLLLAMAGSMLTLVGMIILAPLLSRPLVSLAGLVTTRLFGISGKLAKENALRNPRRTAATASSLMIGLTLITGMTVVGESAQRGMDKMAATGLTADYKVTAGSVMTGLDPELSKKVAQVPGVRAMVPLRGTFFKAGDGFGRLTGTDLAQLPAVTALDFTQGSLDAVRAGGIAVSEKEAAEHHWKAGDQVTVEFSDKPSDAGKQTKLKVAAVYRDNQVIGTSFADMSLVDPHLPRPKNDELLVKADGGGSEKIAEEIRHALGDSPLLKVQSHADLSREAAGEIDTIMNMVLGLLAMALVIAVVGVVNTLAMSVFERTREIGMLRAIGLARSGIKQMVRLESVVISLFGAVLGMGVGIFLAWSGGQLTGSAFPTYEMVLPWGRLGLFLLIALVVGVLAALWPARRAARLNMLEAIGAQ
ncbi:MULTISPECIES: ABC transporter permease [Streptomyces]|uniref:ABC transporter permease n=1 Tax=Streptomyces kasugaensis TaxID=1946 RepID=A0A4Q9HQD6_STRKA|nr:ABC transporter permease [Streptomyces kasugaensis]TBO57133.1 ABC transporter permease [Streptomyces kasugaensis]